MSYTLDILCQQHYGPYGGDPYESRVVGREGGYEVNGMQDILNVLHTFFTSDEGKHLIHLFAPEHFDICLEGHTIGSYWSGVFTLYAPSQVKHDKKGIYVIYPCGKEDKKYTIVNEPHWKREW